MTARAETERPTKHRLCRQRKNGMLDLTRLMRNAGEHVHITERGIKWRAHTDRYRIIVVMDDEPS